VSRAGLARRVAALERAKAPPPAIDLWPPWRRLLSGEEDLFLGRLLPRRPRPEGGPWPDWRDGYRAMCRGEAERATLEAIFAKVPPATDPDAALVEYQLELMFLELGAMLAGEREAELEPEPG
jgi:hypothetical protein